MKPSDFLTELSNEKLAQYKTAASADASKADKAGDFKKGDKRFSGIVKATNKQFDNDSKKPKNESYTVEDEQIDGMAQGEIREIIKNAIHIKNQLDKGVSLDGWMYSYVTTSNDHLNSVAEQINNPNIDEEQLDELSCWSGYHRVSGTKAGFPGSCAKNKTNEEQLNELDMFAPRTVYFKMADGNYIKADYRGSEGLSGHKGNDNVTFTAMSWVPPNTARTLGLDKFLAKGSDPDLGTTRQNAQSIVGTSSPGEGPLGNRTIDVVDFVNGKEDTVPSQLKTQVMQWVQKNQSKPQAPAQGVAEGSTETTQQQQVRAAITKGMAKWDQSDLATYKSQPTNLQHWDPSGWASGQLKGINSIDPDGTVVIELDDTTTAGLVKKLATLGGMPGVKTRQLKITFDPSKANAAGVTQGIVAEEKCPHCGGVMVSEELMNEKKDACYYKVKSRYKVWPSAYASGALVKCRKSHGSWGNGGKKNESSILEGIESVDESLHDWFSKEKWVRMDTKGNIKGPCAREPGEGKPKCLPQSKAHSLGKKGRASAAARKRREDPNPDRTGKAINVNTKKEK